MEVAVLSDIHGNHIAFEACIEEVKRRGITHLLLLGDYIGEFAYPQKTMQLLYELQKDYDCHFVRGNKEEYQLDYRKDGESGWKEQDSTTGSLLYVYRNLTADDLDFFEALPITEKVVFPGQKALTICHGSPLRVNQKLLPENEEVLQILKESETDWIICGHTHVQKKFSHARTTVLDVGSVGLPFGTEGRAQFAVLHGNGEDWREEILEIPYDIDRAIAELHEAELDWYAPSWCEVTKHALRNGTISHGSVLNRAMELCRQAEGSCVWPDVPERYWKQAVEEL